MRIPRELYQLEEQIMQRLPTLSLTQALGLALWVYGTVLAHSACENAVVAAVSDLLLPPAARQRLREWLKDGADKARPGHAQVEVSACFPFLVRWIIAWWQQSTTLAFACDAVSHQDRVVGLVISLLYRGCAIPVAWPSVPAQAPGAWMPHSLTLVDQIAPAIPTAWTAMILVDRGLWSPQLWRHLRQRHIHPLVRIAEAVTVHPANWRGATTAAHLVAKPGYAWVGQATVFSDDARQSGTVIIVWGIGHKQRWVLLTDLPPWAVKDSWYGLRMWIELGFRALKSLGWQWQHTRRTDPERVTRHWLVLAVATLWVLGCGTREADAEQLGVLPGRLRVPPHLPAPCGWGSVSLFQRGLSAACRQLGHGRIWQQLWLRPSDLPDSYLNVTPIRFHPTREAFLLERYIPL